MSKKNPLKKVLWMIMLAWKWEELCACEAYKISRFSRHTIITAIIISLPTFNNLRDGFFFCIFTNKLIIIIIYSNIISIYHHNPSLEIFFIYFFLRFQCLKGNCIWSNKFQIILYIRSKSLSFAIRYIISIYHFHSFVTDFELDVSTWY